MNSFKNLLLNKNDNNIMDYKDDGSYDTQSIRSQGSDMYTTYNVNDLTIKDTSLQDYKPDEVNKSDNIVSKIPDDNNELDNIVPSKK